MEHLEGFNDDLKRQENRRIENFKSKIVELEAQIEKLEKENVTLNKKLSQAMNMKDIQFIHVESLDREYYGENPIKKCMSDLKKGYPIFYK